MLQTHTGKHWLLLQKRDSTRQMSWEEGWLLRLTKEARYLGDSCALICTFLLLREKVFITANGRNRKEAKLGLGST